MMSFFCSDCILNLYILNLSLVYKKVMLSQGIRGIGNWSRKDPYVTNLSNTINKGPLRTLSYITLHT